MGKLGRVENDHVELAPRIAVVAQHLEGIASQILVAGPVESVLGHVALGLLQHGNRAIDVRDRPGAGSSGEHGKPAGIGEDVEQLLAGDKARLVEQRAVLALVEVEPCFVPFHQIDEEAQAMLAYLDGRRRLLAGKQAACGRQALLLAHVHVRPFDDAGRAGQLGQGARQHRLAALDAHRQRLQDEVVRVAIDDESGQEVGLRVDEAVSRGVRL